ncbi:MAG: thioredoxin [Candidatus Aureabacteria bacterium]|nr:thioredoxin [Candidatus Auribacterota bacterium]
MELTNQNFQESINSGVTLVDFWAPWCGPCRMQSPIIEQVNEKINGKAKVAKLNVDESQDIAETYGIQSIPTLIIFKDGNAVKSFTGVQSESNLISAIENQL